MSRGIQALRCVSTLPSAGTVTVGLCVTLPGVLCCHDKQSLPVQDWFLLALHHKQYCFSAVRCPLLLLSFQLVVGGWWAKTRPWHLRRLGELAGLECECERQVVSSSGGLVTTTLVALQVVSGSGGVVTTTLVALQVVSGSGGVVTTTLVALQVVSGSGGLVTTTLVALQVVSGSGGLVTTTLVALQVVSGSGGLVTTTLVVLQVPALCKV